MKQNAIKLFVALVALTVAAPAFAQYAGYADLGTYDPLDERAPFNQTGDRVLSPDTLYTLSGFYYVEPGASLTIPAGTVVQGRSSATFIIKPGAQIFSTGEANNPVVLTSNRPAGTRSPGNWGGVVILGEARVNKENPVIEGGIIEGTYGGTNDADDSGIFRYTRIEFPGYRFQLNNEINGLTMGGVGSGTELHHVQVSYSQDDSYEWFGGAVDAKYLVAMGGTDDEFDTDFGYRGRLQYVFGLRDPSFSDPEGSSNGFESDNDGDGSSDWPQTHPKFSNVTLIGPMYVGALPPGETFANAGVLRRNSRISVFNSVIAGYERGLSVRDLSRDKAADDTLQFWNNEVTGDYEYSTQNIHDTGRWPAVGTWFAAPARSNADTIPRSYTTQLLGAGGGVIPLNNPDPIPQVGSPLIGTADFTQGYVTDSFFDVVTYRGAFDPSLPMSSQWTAGWTNFDPINTDYGQAVSAVGDEVPGLKATASNYPNPFNPNTNIMFTAPVKGHVDVTVYDIRGRSVAKVFSGQMGAGETQNVLFEGKGLASGTYFYRVSGNGFEVTEKMQLVK